MSYLDKVIAAEITAAGEEKVTAVIRLLLGTVFKGQNVPMPNVSVRDNLGSKWLGRCVFNPNKPDNSTVLIQKSVMSDPKSLERVVAHELIHHLDYMTNTKQYMTPRPPDAHGTFFKEWAAKINSSLGKDFVTETSNASIVTTVQRDYLVLVIRLDSGKFGYAWCQRPSKEQQEYIELLKQKEKGVLVRTKEDRFLNGVKIKPYGGVSVPKDPETQDRLRQMYESAAGTVTEKVHARYEVVNE